MVRARSPLSPLLRDQEGWRRRSSMVRVVAGRVGPCGIRQARGCETRLVLQQRAWCVSNAADGGWWCLPRRVPVARVPREIRCVRE